MLIKCVLGYILNNTPLARFAISVLSLSKYT